MSSQNNKERREFPRANLLAQVQVSRDSEVYIMSTRNISRGGLFIQGTPTEYPDLHLGTEVDLMIFSADNPEDVDISVRGRIMRVEGGSRPGLRAGFGLQFIQTDQEITKKIEQLIQKTTTTN